MVNTLSDGLAASADSDGPLCGIGQHFRGHLDRGSGNLADLTDLGTSFSNQRPALGGRHNQPKRDGGSGCRVGCHQIGQILKMAESSKEKRKIFAKSPSEAKDLVRACNVEFSFWKLTST